MLNFDDALNNEDAESPELNIIALRTWYYALILISSNFFGIPLLIYAHRHYFFVLTGSTFAAMFISILYHTCQTTGVCFGIPLRWLTFGDHVSATMFMMSVILFIANSRSTEQIKNRIKTRAYHYKMMVIDPNDLKHGRGEHFKNRRLHLNNNNNKNQQIDYHNKQIIIPLDSHHSHHYHIHPNEYYKTHNVLHHTDKNGYHHNPWYNSKYERETGYTQEDVDLIESRKVYYNTGYSKQEPNTLSNAWDVYTLITSFYIVLLAVIAHPFGMQAFVIAITFGLLLLLVKVTIIDEGIPLNMYHRIYIPDLVIGLIMVLISLVFYMLDIYWEYGITHSLWHIFSFLGIYFMIIGLSKNVDGWYSPTRWIYIKIRTKCIGEHYFDDEEEHYTIEERGEDEEEDLEGYENIEQGIDTMNKKFGYSKRFLRELASYCHYNLINI